MYYYPPSAVYAEKAAPLNMGFVQPALVKFASFPGHFAVSAEGARIILILSAVTALQEIHTPRGAGHAVIMRI
ncbi:MAG: hypothetical protein ABIB11_00095 [Candidatus Omnitrophota bacterium]